MSCVSITRCGHLVRVRALKPVLGRMAGNRTKRIGSSSGLNSTSISTVAGFQASVVHRPPSEGKLH